jgi:hypothetical protein
MESHHGRSPIGIDECTLGERGEKREEEKKEY